MRELLTICQGCDRYKERAPERGECLSCGCRINLDKNQFNKLYMGTEKCPLKKW